jgi:predicted Zn-dependent protease|tara:strand:- start:31 stop:615 length:585 start_codon:yes stop_codon:yes gene_type:complete
MKDIIQIAMGFIIYVVFFAWSVLSLATPASASDYKGNFERIPLVDKRPPQIASWSLPPTIVVCEYAPVSYVQVASATAFWEQLGYRFFKVQYKTQNTTICTAEEPRGHIVIHLVTEGVALEETSLAQTQFYVNNFTNKIEYAKIYMRNDVRETVLEHELGHALGFLHFNKINHLMNEKWTMSGWDKEGLENKRP